MLRILPLIVLISQTVTAQESFKCPHEYGFYPHQKSCDKYWKCENSVASLKTCGNGLGFDTGDAKFLTENCDYLHNVDCGDRSQLEPPHGSANCPRLYGIFPDEQRCDTFWSCWSGESNKYTCAPGLAYDRDARVCMWADQVPECKVTETDGGFKCPNPSDNPNPGTFSRHAHPEDCRKYYICLDGSPREYGCPVGTVFQIGSDPFSGQCTDPEGVDGCEKYYGDDLKGIRKSELLLGLSGGDSGSSSYSVTQKPTIRKKVQQKTKPVEVSQPAAAQSIQTGSRIQNTRDRVQQPRPTQSTTPRPVPTRPPPTTEAPKQSSDKNDDYYYYDNYEDAAAPSAPKQGQQ